MKKLFLIIFLFGMSNFTFAQKNDSKKLLLELPRTRINLMSNTDRLTSPVPPPPYTNFRFAEHNTINLIPVKKDNWWKRNKNKVAVTSIFTSVATTIFIACYLTKPRPYPVEVIGCGGPALENEDRH